MNSTRLRRSPAWKPEASFKRKSANPSILLNRRVIGVDGTGIVDEQLADWIGAQVGALEDLDSVN